MSPESSKPGDIPGAAEQQQGGANGTDEVGKVTEPGFPVSVNPTGLAPASGDETSLTDADFEEASAKLAKQEKKRPVVEDWRAGRIEPTRWDISVVWLTRIAQIAALILAAIQIYRQWPATGLSLTDLWNLLSAIVVALVFWLL
jgi:hypothetical protein